MAERRFRRKAEMALSLLRRVGNDEAANRGGLAARYHKYFAASAIRTIATMANAPICTQILLTKPPLLLFCASIAGSSLDGRPASQSPMTFPVVGLTRWIRVQTRQVKDRKVPSLSLAWLPSLAGLSAMKPWTL